MTKAVVAAVLDELTAAPAKRMTLGAVTNSRRSRPDRIMVMGVESIGKSTFGASAPDPIFIASEDGLDHLDVPVFPGPATWSDVLDAVDTIAEDEHDYQTLVLDTVDWMEPLVWAHVCKAANVDSIEKVGGGYGKGYTEAMQQWRWLLNGLDRVRDRGMTVILLAHTHVKNFSDPKSEHDWSRYECKMHTKSASVLREWVDVAMFATFDTWAEKREGGNKMRGADSGRRVVYTQHSAAYDAKSRFQLPPVLPFSWAEYAEARAAVEDPQAIMDEAMSMASLMPDAVQVETRKWIELARGDAAQLRQRIDAMKTKLTELTENMK